MTTTRLTDKQWERILEFLRQDPRAYVGNESECRRFVEAVIWMSRSGAQWRLLPETYGNWNSVYKRFARWCKAGVWERMLAYFADEPDMENGLIDSTIVRAHACAAGAAKKKRQSGKAGFRAKSWRLQHKNSRHHRCVRVSFASGAHAGATA